MNTHDIIELATQLHQSRYRSRRIQNFMRDDLKNITIPSLTAEQKEFVKEVWKGIRVDYRWFSFFNMFREVGKDWSPYYVPSNLHYSLIDMYYTDYKKCRTIEDKNLNDLLFRDVKQPRTVVRTISGNLYDSSYFILERKDLASLFSEDKGYLIKPSIESGGGQQIVVWKPNQHTPLIDYLDKISSYRDCIVQEFSSQHQAMASLHPESLNTIRVMTFQHQGRVDVLSTIVRMGVDGSTIDNASVGGIFCGVDNQGRLKNIAYNDYGDIFDRHPSTHVTYSDHSIPNYSDCLKMAKKLHNRLVGFTRLISWDFAIDAAGNPILIEVNATHGGISFHQMCNGPLFGDYTEEVIEEVFNKRNRFLSRIF